MDISEIVDRINEFVGVEVTVEGCLVSDIDDAWLCEGLDRPMDTRRMLIVDYKELFWKHLVAIQFSVGGEFAFASQAAVRGRLVSLRDSKFAGSIESVAAISVMTDTGTVDVNLDDEGPKFMIVEGM